MWASILDASVLIGVSFLRFFGGCAYVLFCFCGVEGKGERGSAICDLGLCVLMWENNRLGEVHGMEIPGCGDCGYESEGIQGCRRC